MCLLEDELERLDNNFSRLEEVGVPVSWRLESEETMDGHVGALVVARVKSKQWQIGRHTTLIEYQTGSARTVLRWLQKLRTNYLATLRLAETSAV